MKGITLLLFTLSIILIIVPTCSADLNYLVQLSSTSGPPGTVVTFALDIQNYFYVKYPPGDQTITGETWENYVGLHYMIIWDDTGSDSWQPQTWNIIGEGWVNDTGGLFAIATIPNNAVAGHHHMTAVYEYNAQ